MDQDKEIITTNAVSAGTFNKKNIDKVLDNYDKFFGQVANFLGKDQEKNVQEAAKNFKADMIDKIEQLEILARNFKLKEAAESKDSTVPGIVNPLLFLDSITTEFKQLSDKQENKANFYISDEATSIFRKYNKEIKNVENLIGCSNEEKEAVDKLLNVEVPYIFNFSSPIQQKRVQRFNDEYRLDLVNLPLKTILNKYLCLILISENRFIELDYILSN